MIFFGNRWPKLNGVHSHNKARKPVTEKVVRKVKYRQNYLYDNEQHKPLTKQSFTLHDTPRNVFPNTENWRSESTELNV